MSRILLAEDHDDNRELLVRRLSRAGHVVTAVADGAAAVDAALASPPDIVLMDLSMPVMGGLDATRALRAAGFASPVVALTAHAMDSAREACREAGCDGFATKPVDFVALLATITELTEQQISGRTNG
jgi:two-component system, cell cycle response regulator DivK